MVHFEILKSKEMIQMFAGQMLIWISQTMQGHVNWVLASVASVMGLVVVYYSIINAIKKAKISDLEIENLKLENEKLNRELENRHLELENANLEKLKSN